MVCQKKRHGLSEKAAWVFKQAVKKSGMGCQKKGHGLSEKAACVF